MIIIEIFTRSVKTKIKSEPAYNSSLSKKIKKHKKILLPWWFKIIAYIISLLVIGISILLILLKGFTMGNEKVKIWLGSVLTSLFFSVILMQPIKVYNFAKYYN